MTTAPCQPEWHEQVQKRRRSGVGRGDCSCGSTRRIGPGSASARRSWPGAGRGIERRWSGRGCRHLGRQRRSDPGQGRADRAACRTRWRGVSACQPCMTCSRSTIRSRRPLHRWSGRRCAPAPRYRGAGCPARPTGLGVGAGRPVDAGRSAVPTGSADFRSADGPGRGGVRLDPADGFRTRVVSGPSRWVTGRGRAGVRDDPADGGRRLRS